MHIFAKQPALQQSAPAALAYLNDEARPKGQIRQSNNMSRQDLDDSRGFGSNSHERSTTGMPKSRTKTGRFRLGSGP